MINGFTITYTSNKDSNKLNHLLFGRLSIRKYHKTKRCYYTPGILDNIPFFKITTSKVFIEINDFFDVFFKKIVLLKAQWNFIETELDCEMITGKEYWENRALKRGFIIYDTRKKRV